jgi:hypothetical protein
MASVLVREEGRLRLYNKGAAEWVLRRCVSYHDEGGQVQAMTDAKREELMEVRAPPRWHAARLPGAPAGWRAAVPACRHAATLLGAPGPSASACRPGHALW